jgi:hypothetical protein
MRVLLTNNTLAHRAGTELYVRDVAIELMRRGHQPVVYSTHLGDVADEIRSATVPVIGSLEALGEAPDIIHAHHNYEAVAAIMQFPQVPAVSFCHGWTPWEEKPLRFPQVRRYVAVSEVCRERLIAEGGISACRVEMLPNFFDGRLFPPRDQLPRSPRLAVSFGHAIGEDSGLPLIRKACRNCGIQLDTMGKANGGVERHPGQVLAQYDIVFARGRCAIEAMAVGAAVILCDVGRLGPMVTSDNFWKLHSMNFALRSLSEPFTEEGLTEAIREYDASEAAAVSAMVRGECEMQPAVDRILAIYEKAIEEARKTGPITASECNRALVVYLEESAEHHKSFRLVEKSLEWTRRERLLQTEIASIQSDIASIRASATWRWTQRVLQNPWVKSVLGGLIQRVAKNSKRAASARESK